MSLWTLVSSKTKDAQLCLPSSVGAEAVAVRGGDREKGRATVIQMHCMCVSNS